MLFRQMYYRVSMGCRGVRDRRHRKAGPTLTDMKVAFVNQPLDLLVPPIQNSIGIWTYQMAPQVAQQHQVLVYGKRTALQKAWHAQKGVHYYFMPAVPNRLLGQLSKLMLPYFDKKRPFFASRCYHLDYALGVAMSLRRQQADVVHVHNFSQLVPVIRALNPRAKIALHMHCEWLSQLDYQVMADRLGRCDLVLGSSEYITDKVRLRFPQYGDRCQTVYNGVDAGRFMRPEASPPTSGEKRLLFVGRVSPEKGVHVLLEAFCRVHEQHPNVRLDLVGPVGAMPREFLVDLSDEPDVAALAGLYGEEYGAQLQRMAASLPYGRVTFAGSRPHEEIAATYWDADILINPSFSEAFGMSLVEAMAAGKPVIATRTGGMTEIVASAQAGFLVERGDAAGLAEAILQLLANDELRHEMGRRGRRAVQEKYAWPRVAERLLHCYEGVLSGAGNQ
jgi:glycosyltransferase involved in cell wall biosynthesis